MRLTSYTDYSFRVLIYLGVRRGQLSTIREISESYDISRHHLVKVVHFLGTLGYVHTVRGKHGGVELALSPDEINLGEVARATEDNFHLVECFDRDAGHCRITPACRLQSILGEALDAFLKVLDRFTLSELLDNPQELAVSLGLPTYSSAAVLDG